MCFRTDFAFFTITIHSLAKYRDFKFKEKGLKKKWGDVFFQFEVENTHSNRLALRVLSLLFFEIPIKI